MKSNHILFSAILAGATLGMTSCGDSFLEETLKTEKGTSYFQTKSGIDDLVTGTYQKLKFKFNYIWGYNVYNSGTDEFAGANNNIAAWSHYSTDLNSGETANNQPVWDNYYGTIEPANIVIANTPKYYGENVSTYNTRLGEGYFFRAYAYFELVKQYGGVPLKLQPSTTPEYYFARNSEEECYAQIIADFEKAYELLPTEPESKQLGRLTKDAAAHFLAKAHLFRASELYSSWNSSYKDADLNAVIKYGQEVIKNHPLCTNFQELWDYTEPDGANEQVDEVVLAAQFSDNSDSWGRFGNQMHLCYPAVYQDMAGTKRDISGDREFSYLSATEYSLQVFDRVNDSRFWKSFITKYGANDTKTAPTWAKDAEALAELRAKHPGAIPDDVNFDDKRFKAGDIGIKYIVNNAGDDRYEDMNDQKSYDDVLKDGVLQPEHVFVHYYKGQTFQWNINAESTDNNGNFFTVYPHKRSVALSKFRDGSRNSIASQFGCRDAIIARSADDVLMVAEAYIRKADYTNAITYLNMVRDRAAYASGEDRSISRDGGQAYKKNSYCTGKGGGYSADGAIYTEENTYYESNNMDVTTASSLSAMHLNSVDDIVNSEADKPIYEALGCTSTADKVMCFLLNERTRELIGESHRWEDLARTKTLEKRWKTFNDGVNKGMGMFNASKHYYRPIPQSFLDGIMNANGASLSDEEKEAMQNPGY